MRCYRLVSRPGVSAAAVLCLLCAIVPEAQALKFTCSYFYNGEVDFGKNTRHEWGAPKESGLVRWTFASVNGAIVRTVRIQGTLYLDRLGPGIARMQMDFLNSGGGAVADSAVAERPGPGGDANLRDNKMHVDVTVTHANLNRVLITYSISDNPGDPAAPLEIRTTTGQKWGDQRINIVEGTPPPRPAIAFKDLRFDTLRAPDVDVEFSPKFNHGSTDFGSDRHEWGGPVSGGSLRLFLRNNGEVTGRVTGWLYWDNYFNGPSHTGTTRLAINYLNKNGDILSSRKAFRVFGVSWDANDPKNKTRVEREFSHRDLFQVQLRISKVVGSNLRVDPLAGSYPFKCRPPESQ